MKHSWQEREDGTAYCRRCPAVRSHGERRFATRTVSEEVTDVGHFEPYTVMREEHLYTLAVIVTGAHPTKCGKAAK